MRGAGSQDERRRQGGTCHGQRPAARRRLGPAGGRGRRFLHAVERDAEGLHRLDDVLDLVPPARDEGKVDLALDLVVDAARQPDPARLAQALDSRGDVDAAAADPVAADPVVVDDQVAEVDPDPVAEPPVLGHARLTRRYRALDLDRGLDGLDRAAELDDGAVALKVDETARCRSSTARPAPAERLEPGEGSRLVELHQPAIADHVGREDGGEPPLEPYCSHGSLPREPLFGTRLDRRSRYP
jgi:hypothetical protein